MKKIYTEAGLDALIKERGHEHLSVVFYALKLEKQEMREMGLTYDQYCAIMKERERGLN